MSSDAQDYDCIKIVIVIRAWYACELFVVIWYIWKSKKWKLETELEMAYNINWLAYFL